jgi:hypothetical protein
MKQKLTYIAVVVATLAQTASFAGNCGKYTKNPTPSTVESDLTPASWSCDCSKSQALSQSKKVTQKYVVNCGNCNEVVSSESTSCKYTDPVTRKELGCPYDDCVQGSTYFGSSVFQTRSIHCGTLTYNVGIGASYNPNATAQVNLANKGALAKLGLIGGLIQLTLKGSAQADANGNVTFCFVYTGDWS